MAARTLPAAAAALTAAAVAAALATTPLVAVAVKQALDTGTLVVAASVILPWVESKLAAQEDDDEDDTGAEVVVVVVVQEGVVVDTKLFDDSVRFGDVGGTEPDDDEADESDETFIEELVDETFLAVSAALFLTIRLIDETDGRLSSSQIPSCCNCVLISQANIVGLAFL